MPTFSPTIALAATFSSSSTYLHVDGADIQTLRRAKNPNGALDLLVQRSKNGN
jgi:hypothetical protein